MATDTGQGSGDGFNGGVCQRRANGGLCVNVGLRLGGAARRLAVHNHG